MGIFSKKEDLRYIKEFDNSLYEINALAGKFRELHFESLDTFNANFEKEKGFSDLEKERVLFEKHLDVLQKLKLNADLLLDEAFKLVRNETVLTEKDRVELRKLLQQKLEPTSISVSVKSVKAKPKSAKTKKKKRR